MATDLSVVDADGHLCEPARLWEDNLPPRLREQGIRLRWNEQTGYDECLVEDRMATDRGLVGLGNAGRIVRRVRARPPLRRSESRRLRRARAREGARRGGHRRRGDVSRTRSEARRDHRIVTSRSSRARSTTTGSRTGARRLPIGSSGVGALPLQDPKRAADEARRIAGLGLKAGFARPNAYNDRPLHHPVYTPVWEALSETGLPIAFHPAGLSDMPGASRALGGLMAPGHAPRADPAHRPAADVVESHLRRRARTVPGTEGDRARVRRRLDRALDGPPRRVPRELRLGDADTVVDAARVLPTPVLDQLRSGRAHRAVAVAAHRRRSHHVGLRLPALRREVSRCGRRAARVHRGDGRSTRAPGCSVATPPRCTRCDRRLRSSSSPAEPSSTAPARRPARPTSRSANGRIAEVGRIDASAGARAHRRRRAARHARVRRHPHPLRRAAALGPDRVARVMARRHHADDRQLRLHARAEQARRRRLVAR